MSTVQADTEVVTGVVAGIVQKGPDKWQVQVDIGRANPRGLWTKDQNLVAQLSMMIGQHTSFLCGHSNWTRQDGSPVTSLWINGVGPAGGFQPQQAQQPAPMPAAMPTQWPQQQPSTLPIPQQAPTVVTPTVVQSPVRVSEEEREARIHRQTASKVAGILISHLPQEQRTLDNVLKISESLVRYYEHGVQWEQDGNPGEPPPHTDDDIPF